MTANVILFEHVNFHGAHKHVFVEEANLNSSDDNFFNDRVSSVIVVEGVWTFYKDSNFSGRKSNAVGPGRYSSVTAINIDNDAISSLSSIRH